MKIRITFVRSALFGALIMLGLASTVAAQTRADRGFHIPFDFIINAKTIPAGDYTVELTDVNRPWLLRLRRIDGPGVRYFIAPPTGASGDSTINRLSFHRYGNLYFLRQVSSAGGGPAHELMPSRTEKRLRKEARRKGSDPAVALTEIMTGGF